MTLVVARVTPLGVRLAADMRITDQNDTGPRGFLGAALKVILLRPTLCIGYAALNVNVALDAIRKAWTDGLSADDAAEHLLGVHRDSGQVADFLVASLRPSKVAAVKNGALEVRDANWIGDQHAYAEYQRHYLRDTWEPPRSVYDSPERADDLGIARRIGNGMFAVVHGAPFAPDGTVTTPSGGSYLTVGESIVNVVPRSEDNFFKYSIAHHAMASPFQEELPSGLGVVPMDTSATAGGFSYTTLTPEQPGVGVIGIYIDQASLGILYAPLLHDEPQRYPGISRDAFVELVRLRYSVSLVSLLA